MILRCDKLPEDFSGSVAYARIKAYDAAFSGTLGQEIFMQKIGGETTSVFGKSGGGYSLDATGNADISELDSYFKFVGAAVFCEASLAEKLKPENKKVFGLYTANKLDEISTGLERHVKIADVYYLLEKGCDGDIELPPFEYWYTDFCIRFNHQSAEYAVCGDSVAVCGFMTDKASVVTGVATALISRGKGGGSKALSLLADKIYKKYPESKIYVAAGEKAAGFYEKCGFIRCKDYAECRF